MIPYFSIIIPTHNEELHIRKLLNSISQQSYRDFEVIVSDSASLDKTREVCESYKDAIPLLTVLDKETENVSAARNNGAAHAQGEYLIFFDADVYIEEHFLKSVKRHIQVDHPTMMALWNRPSPASIKGRIIFGLMNRSVQLLERIHPTANGPGIIMKRGLFESIGGFDQTIFFGEDFDLIKRAHQIGGKMRVYKNPLFFVSTRRFEKEGLIVSLYKSIRAVIHQLFLGPIRKPIFKYEMGGQYYEDKK